MNLTTKAWTDYITRLAQLNEKAGQLMADYLASHGTADTDALIAYASALVTKYGEGSAELACQMYDAMAALQKASVPPAEPAMPAGRSEVARMVQATKDSQPRMQQGVSRLVKRAAADTTVKNALRDGAEWAWVPHGDTCPFCLTLASRGWQKASNAVLKGGHAEHIHANCDCEFAVRFDGRTGVAGYDPDRYLAQYNAAGGDLNKLRRINYAANKDRINAQKRAAYAARKASKHAADNISTGLSVGAKAKNYIVVDKTSGEEYYFVEGTRTQNPKVFAGKGGVKPLREEVAQGLSAEFGGNPEDWQHCKAYGWLDVNGESIKAEVHWFQNGSEKVKFKVKRWLYDED